MPQLPDDRIPHGRCNPTGGLVNQELGCTIEKIAPQIVRVLTRACVSNLHQLRSCELFLSSALYPILCPSMSPAELANHTPSLK